MEPEDIQPEPQYKSQLAMIHELKDVPPIVLPEGVTLRTWRPGDEAIWAAIMETGLAEDWTAEKVLEKFAACPQFSEDCVFFADLNGKTVGSASAWRNPPENTETGTVHMVCALPEARGKQIGYLVTLATLHWFLEHNFNLAVLTTDDFRIPAIKSYLRLGFEPLIQDDTHPHRWEKVMSIINGDKT